MHDTILPASRATSATSPRAASCVSIRSCTAFRRASRARTGARVLSTRDVSLISSRAKIERYTSLLRASMPAREPSYTSSL